MFLKKKYLLLSIFCYFFTKILPNEPPVVNQAKRLNCAHKFAKSPFLPLSSPHFPAASNKDLLPLPDQQNNNSAKFNYENLAFRVLYLSIISVTLLVTLPMLYLTLINP